MDSAVRRAFSTRRRGLSAPSGVDDVDAVPYLPWKKRVFGIGPEHPVCFVPGTAPASKLSALRAYFFCSHPRYPAPCLIFRTFRRADLVCALILCVAAEPAQFARIEPHPSPVAMGRRLGVQHRRPLAVHSCGNAGRHHLSLARPGLHRCADSLSRRLRGLLLSS